MSKKKDEVGKKRITKSTEEFANEAFNKMKDTAQYIKHLEEKITHLEQLLKDSPVPNFDEKQDKPLEEQIIETEIRRMHQKVMNDAEYELVGQELKKFDTLVKSLVALRGKPEKKSTKEENYDSKEEADLLELVESFDN